MKSARSSSLRDISSDRWQPIRKRMWIDAGVSGGTGFAIVEFSPAGIRWYWEHDEEGAQEVSFEQIVAGTFCVHADDVRLYIERANAEIDLARRKIAAIDRSAAWKIHRAEDRE